MEDLQMVLDRSMLERVRTYLIYRSEEVATNDSPIADGLYLQREAIHDPPPERIRISITWD